jgi:predicted short-subunit dehydrogenase-like oxidoreductase (DUF2520 family)
MKIGIIGAGKVGIVLARSLKEKGFNVAAIASRREESLATAREYVGEGPLYITDNLKIAEICDVIGITTQDREIGRVAEEICTSGLPVEGKTFFHTSGAHKASELAPLDTRGAHLGSLHPLQSFPDIDTGLAALPDTHIFIEGNDAALDTLQVLARAVGYDATVIQSDHKTLYHLSAVFVCNLLSTLFYSAQAVMDKIDINLKPFYPIIHATLRNIETKGPLASLTGPVVRGDAGTVAAHLKAMQEMGLDDSVYKVLSAVAIEMAEKRGLVTDEQIKELEATLK